MAPRTWAKMARGVKLGLDSGGCKTEQPENLSAHRETTMGARGSWEAKWWGAGADEEHWNPGCVISAKSHFSRPDLGVFQVAPVPQFLGVLRSLFALQNSCFLGHRSFFDGVHCVLAHWWKMPWAHVCELPLVPQHQLIWGRASFWEAFSFHCCVSVFKVGSQQKWPFFWATRAIQPENNFLFTFLTKWAVCHWRLREELHQKYDSGWRTGQDAHLSGEGMQSLTALWFLWALLSRPALSLFMDFGHCDALRKSPTGKAMKKMRNWNLKSVILFFDG